MRDEDVVVGETYRIKCTLDPIPGAWRSWHGTPAKVTSGSGGSFPPWNVERVSDGCQTWMGSHELEPLPSVATACPSEVFIELPAPKTVRIDWSDATECDCDMQDFLKGVEHSCGRKPRRRW